jgi:hypothetical protein
MSVRFQGAKKITNKKKSQRGRKNDPDNVNKDSRLAHGLGSALGSVYSVRSPTQRAPFLCQKLPSLSLSFFGALQKWEKNVFKSNVYQTNFLTKQKTAEVTACESP